MMWIWDFKNIHAKLKKNMEENYMEIDPTDQNIVRFEPTELTDYIKNTVTKMIEEQEVIEKAEDYDRLLDEAESMRKRMEELEAKVSAQARELAAQRQVAMKDEDDVEPVEETDEERRKREEEEKRKRGNVEEEEDRVKKLEAELAAIKSSPMYKANMDVTPITETPVTSTLGNIIHAHYGGN